MKEKKVEVFKVRIKTLDESELAFESILLNKDFHNVDIKSGGRYSQLAFVNEYDEYIVGMIQSTKMDSTPPKRNVETDVTSALGLKKEEGLLYGNVFLYNKEKKVLLYEVTRDGLFAGQLNDFIYGLVRDYDIPKFDIRFLVLMNADAMYKLLTMGEKKSIHMQFANPDEMIRKIKNGQKSIKEIAKPGKDFGAELIDVTYKVTSSKDKFLNSGHINNMLEFIDEKIELLRDNVRKFSVRGYEEDEEGITEVDLIKDKMIEKIKYEEAKNSADLKPLARKQEIILAYDRLRKDIYRYL